MRAVLRVPHGVSERVFLLPPVPEVRIANEVHQRLGNRVLLVVLCCDGLWLESGWHRDIGSTVETQEVVVRSNDL